MSTSRLKNFSVPALFQRLSDNFLVADFLANDSVIRHGMSNSLNLEKDRTKKQNAQLLVQLLDGILDISGVDTQPMSISYGYISPEVSERIVKYMNPKAPSYHRWDDGAAADIIAHAVHRGGKKQRDYVDMPAYSPIAFAMEIAKHLPFSRMITYAESPGICVAAKKEIKPRLAFYENRYCGDECAKPKHIKHTSIDRYSDRDRELVLSEVAKHGWVGRGYPSYHGMGRLQYHHIKLGYGLTMLDCLRCPMNIAIGVPNPPPDISNVPKKKISAFKSVAKVFDNVLMALHKPGVHRPGRVHLLAGHKSRIANYENVFKKFPLATDNDWSSGNGAAVIAFPIDYRLELADTLKECLHKIPVSYRLTNDDDSVYVMLETEL